MKLKDLKVNPELVNKGEWIGNLPELEDLEVHVRGLGNPDYRRVQAQKIRQLPRSKRVGGMISDEDNERIMTECLHETCLLGWRNLLGDDDKPLPYTKEKAKELLFDPQYADFRDAVVYAARQVGRNKVAEKEVQAKN